MKLYTEEEIKRTFGFGFSEMNFNGFMKAMRPIELPTDEEIEVKAQSSYNDPASHLILGFVKGAKWMRDKIKGGNK